VADVVVAKVEAADVEVVLASDSWVFGYGSLIFRPDFPFVERREGFVSGWSRRFWQASTDHRGTPDAPGRVVTLVEMPNSNAWGVAFRIDDSQRERILELLDLREQQGYTRRSLPFTDRVGERFDVLVYVADESNPHYVGPEDELTTVGVVHGAHGPSGANRDYVLQLHDALEELGADDAHVRAIARALPTLPALPSSSAPPP
jgi:glutathione-specific gamma-glutamylcyclotransferase